MANLRNIWQRLYRLWSKKKTRKMVRGDEDILQNVYQWNELEKYIGPEYVLNLLSSAWCKMELKIHFSPHLQLIHFRCWIARFCLTSNECERHLIISLPLIQLRFFWYFFYRRSSVFHWHSDQYIQLRDSLHYKLPFSIATMCMFILSMEPKHTKCQIFTKLSPNYPEIK